MKIAQVVGGFSLAEADLLRRAMGKKKEEIMAQKKVEFIQGAKARGYPEKVCGDIFNKMAEFAKYGFNKSHSAAYALVAYQTAYLKANYPIQFMAALLTLDKDNTDKVVNYIDKCRQNDIAIKPPDVRRSRRKFSVEGGDIRFAFGAIKGVGDSALESIMQIGDRGDFDSFHAFFEKVDFKRVNKKVVEQLVKSGAFDFTGCARRGMFEAIEAFLAWGQKTQRETAGGQGSLFGESAAESCSIPISEEEWPRKELLAYEKEALGIYISGHPLDAYRKLLAKHATCNTSDLERMSDGSELILGGIVQSIRKIVTAKGDDMAFVNLEDDRGLADVVVFPRGYEKYRHLLEDDAMLVVKGKLQMRNERPNVLVDEMWNLSEWEARKVRSCVIQFDADAVEDQQLDRLHAHLSANRGDCQLFFEVTIGGKHRAILKPESYQVDAGRPLTAFTRENPVFKMLLRY